MAISVAMLISDLSRMSELVAEVHRQLRAGSSAERRRVAHAANLLHPRVVREVTRKLVTGRKAG